MILDLFSSRKQWKSFLEQYSDNNIKSAIADESIWPFLISAFKGIICTPLIIVTSTRERAVQLQKEIRCISPKTKISIFGGIGSSIFYRNRKVDQGSLAEKLDSIKNLIEYSKNTEKEKAGNPPLFIITSSSLINMIPEGRIDQLDLLMIKKGREYIRDELIEWLTLKGYERVHQVYDKGEFSIRGDILTIFDITRRYPVRIDFFMDEVEKIKQYDPVEHKDKKDFLGISIFPNVNLWKFENDPASSGENACLSFFDIIKKFIPMPAVIFCDPLEVYLKLKSDIDMMHRIFERDSSDLVIQDRKKLSGYIVPHDFLEKEEFDPRLDLLSIRESKTSADRFYFSNISRQKKSLGNAAVFTDNIKSDIKAGKKILILLNSKKRKKKIKDLFLENSISFEPAKGTGITETALKKGIVYFSDNELYRGFNSKKISVYGELDIYQQMESGIREGTAAGEGDSQFFKPGDHIVHKNHGIGIYIDTISRQISGIKREYFLIEYGKGDKLYIPTWQADRISKYIGSKNPSITSLDSKQWDNLKKKARRSIQKLAVDLVRLYAERQSRTGYSFPKDSAWQSEIEQLFPFIETPDQVKAIEYVKKAMERSRPMDVLVVGDVGFGKTEVAIRAAFKALEEGKQVLMLVPTTILADQHYNTFSTRYRDYPVVVEVISRFIKKKKQSQIVDDFNLGRVDMLIGTHRVLQKDIKPHDLGLIIVDEEQRFGVNSKEKIKLIKKEVDVLTLTATPIPRTLYMSMAGVRDMALIETYPEGRNPIETFVGEMDPPITRNAIEREIARGGQVYYVYNRISGIEQRMHQLVRLVPESRIILAHGRMDGLKVEKIMNDFINKKYDVLLTTSIIESGMDIENVNTLIVENSHMFGLSQLYQLRGRVGRSSEQAYAYFFYPNQRGLGTTAFQRLKTLSEYTDLGSGYNVAMKDLEIRGAGEILGPRQHGHINSIGFDMYCQIIKEETGRLKGIAVPEDLNIQIDLPLSAYIPRYYIKSQKARVNIYRDLGTARSFEKIEDIKKNLEEKYGTIPKIVLDLLGISKIKFLLGSAGIERLKYSKGRGIVLKSIVLDDEKFKKIKNSNANILYQPQFEQITIKNMDKKIDLDLVIGYLGDIIGAM
ncbi:MAG: transcription-repair coupling factor [Candidatus Humimicrobiaceae bacterium]